MDTTFTTGLGFSMANSMVFSSLLIQMFSDLPQIMVEGTVLEMERGMVEEESVMETQSGSGKEGISSDRSKTMVSGSGLFQCASLGNGEPLVLQLEGDVVIGGLFPLHYLAPKPQNSYRSKPQHAPCSGFDHRAFRWMMTMVFAVEEINGNSSLLPGVRLGYRIMDSCDHVHTSLRALLSLINHNTIGRSKVEKMETMKETLGVSKYISSKMKGRMSGVIGGKLMKNTAEKTSKQRTLRERKKRGIESGITKPHRPENQGNSVKENMSITDERMEGTTHSKSLPSCLAGAPVSAVIGLASSSPTGAVAHTLGPFSIPVDDYSRYGIQAFSQQLRQQGGCLAFHLTIPKSPTVAGIGDMADTLQSSKAKVVVAFATEGQLLGLLSELAKRNVTGIQWVASEAWVTASLLTSPRFQSLLEGTLGFSFPGVWIPGLKEFLLKVRPSPEPGSEFVNIFWEELFGCRLEFGGDRSTKNSTGNLHNIMGEDDHRSKPDLQTNSGSWISPAVGENRAFKGSVGGNYEGAGGKPVCTGSENLGDTDSSYTDVSQVRISYNVYKAVYAIAHALHHLLECDPIGGTVKGRCEHDKSFTSRQLLHQLKTVNFTNQFEEKVYFDSNGEPVPLYDIINWQKDSKDDIRFIKVGSYDGSAPLGQQLQMDQSTIVWTGGQSQVPVSLCSAACPPGSRQARRPGEPHCCFDCLPCADGEISNETDSTECTKCPEYYWSDKDKVKCVAGVDDFLSLYDTMGIILVTLTLLGVVVTAIITTVFHRFRATPIVRANNSEISFLLLLSLKFCFLCSLAFIGQPSVWTCRLRQAAFGVSFVLCLSCLLVKTIVVLLAFRATVPSSRGLKLFGPSQQRTLILCTTAPQICLCAGWLSGAPPFPFRNPTYQASTGKIVVECKEPWPPGFYMVLGYIGLLASLCLLLAFLGRKLPDTFNEAKLITFSMLIFCAVWISFIPAHVSSPGKFTVAVEIFAILASSFGLLLCIFVPKCYIILLRPERNVKKVITVKYAK
ncbi:olfactory receptor CU1 [Polymixia lowei]